MEILNNIWNALTTENVALINILSIPCTFVEIYIMLITFCTILNINHTKRQSIIFVVISSMVSITSYYVIPPPYYTVFDYIVMFILIKILFKLSSFKTIIAIVSAFFIYTLIGSLILNPFIKVFNTTYDIMYNTPLYRISYLFMIYFLMFIIIELLNFKKSHLNILEHFNKSNKSVIVTNIIFALFTLCVQFIITFYYINTYSIIFTLLNFISLFAYFFVSFMSLNRTMNLQLKTEQLEKAENYNNTLLTLYDSVRGFKHDLNNILHLIGGYIDTNDMEGLKQYYSDLRKDSVRIKNAELLNPNLINNPGIYNLIVSKQQRATDLKTNISLEVFFDFKKLHMPVYDFSRILGILLDNAIEAASECEEKQVLLMFRDSPSNNTQIISIENTYNNKDIDVQKIFEKGISGKDKHSGIGLWEVNQIINKHNNVVLNTSKNDKYFKQQLEIYY